MRPAMSTGESDHTRASPFSMVDLSARTERRADGGRETMDLPAMRARADELMLQFDRMRSGVGDLQRKLKAVEATVTSEDGLVTATVGPRGQVVKVEFDPRIYRRPDSREL